MNFELEIIWSARAKITYFNVLDYLNKNWTRKELVQFSQRTQVTINAIRKNPGIFPISSKNKEIRRALVDKNNLFFYKVDISNKRLYLLTFFDCRQDPKTLLF